MASGALDREAVNDRHRLIGLECQKKKKKKKNNNGIIRNLFLNRRKDITVMTFGICVWGWVGV